MIRQGTWTTRGFEMFRQGTLGNAGQNLYVSRSGVLQRIHQYDLNGDGYLDLVFCNSQNHWERPPVYVYAEPLGHIDPLELAAEGAWSGTVADLNGDGYDDLVVGMWYNGIRKDLNAVIYYGSPQGLSERRQQQLPVPRCTSVAAGDFNGDGQIDLAFLSAGRLRLFYQSALGFEPKRFVDLPIEGQQLTSTDVDGDGYADLVIRTQDGRVAVYWGGQTGIDPEQVLWLPDEWSTDPVADEPALQARYAEYAEESQPLARVVHLGGMPHLFVPRPQQVLLAPVAPDRRLGDPLQFHCQGAKAVAAGDVDGDGYADLVFACRPSEDGDEGSWIYWGDAEGYSETRRTRLQTRNARDAIVYDLDSSGYADIVICQGHTQESYTAESLVYRGAADRLLAEPLRLVSHDARRVLVARSSGDASPQLVLINYYSRNRLGNVQPRIYFGGNDGFSPERYQDVAGWGAVEAIGCDINDDGYVDLVLANASENSVTHDPGSYVLLSGPAGLSSKPNLVLPTTRAHGACCADLNHDGYLDLIFCGFDSPELLVFYGTAEGFDTDHPERIRLEHEGVVYNEPRWIYLADLNNNGWLDLVVPQIAYDRSLVLWGGPAGFSMERCQLLSVVRGACARAIDLTGNGYLDLVIGGHMPDLDGPHDSFVYIYWNGPEGLREDNRILLPAKTINAMALADFNKDGLHDLFICSYHGGKERDVESYIYWNRAGRGFSASDRSRLFTHSASGCVAADFNGDGWIDLAIANHKVDGDHVGYSAVWWNGPDGFDEKRVTRLPTTGPHGMMAVEPGNIVDRGPEEYYLSVPFLLPSGTHVAEVTWLADCPPNTWVKAQLRFAPSPEELESALWLGPAGVQSWYQNGQTVQAEQSAGQWVQYRLALGAVNGCGTPRVQEVSVQYREA